MKKRILTLLLVLLTVLPLAAEAYAAAAPAHIEDYNIVTENKALGTGTPSESTLFSTAYVRNANIGSTKPNGDPRKLDVVVNMKQSDRAYLCAIVMSAEDYAKRYPNGPADPQGNITASNYWNLGSTLTGAAYAIGRRTGTSTLGQQVSLRLVTPSSANVSTLDAGNAVAYKDLQVAAINGDNYYREYVLIVFGQNAEGSDKASSYYIDRFYLDASGYVATPSYGVKYVCDNAVFDPVKLENYSVQSIPAGNAGSQVDLFRAAWTDDRDGAASMKPEPEKSTVTTSKPTRTGARFIGWTTEQRPVLAADATAPVSHAEDPGFYAPGEKYDEPAEMYKVYNLYALWQEVPVRFNHTAEDPDTKLITFDQVPQVGVAFNASGNSSNYTQNPGGNKRFQVKVYEAESLDITNPDPAKLHPTACVVNGAVGKPSNADAAKLWLSDAGTSVTTPYGLIVRRTNGTDNNNWQIIGTPSNYSEAGKHVWLCITVQDSSCATTDTVWVYFDQIKKGAQPIPTLDDNTGLQSRLEKADIPDDSGGTVTVDDGQLYGFYSAGPTIETDENQTGYKPVTGDVTTGTNGVNGQNNPGTMTGYYLNLGMVYEYRPITVSGEDVDHAGLPNEGWREIPFPQGWYNDEELALLTPSLALNAKTLTYSTRQGNNNAEIQAQTPPDGFEGWPDSYGYIAFDETSKLPVVHGLAADDVYEVRFRANSIYEVSEAQTLTIGGAVGSGTGGTANGGLAVNLAGGRVTDDPDTDADETDIYTKFVNKCKTLQEGDTVDIPDVTPGRDGYTFLGWTLGEYDENGLLILYKYPEKADENEGGGDPEGGTEGGDAGAEGSGEDGAGDTGSEGNPGEETPEEPQVTYLATVTLTDSPMALAAVWESTPYAITFYDWDGRVIDAIGAPNNAVAAVKAWQTQDWVLQRLTKPGYDFDNWIVVYENNDGEGLHAKAGSLTSRKAQGEDDKLNEADIADFGDLEKMAKENSKAVLVQAVYVANETVNDSLGEDANLNLPTTQYELDDKPTYYQYGPATSEVATYGITFTIKRNSMLRTDTPTIQARIYSNPTGTKSDIVTVRLDLENTDETTFEVFVPKSATQVDVVLRDTYGQTDWTNAQPRSTRITIEKGTFVYEGAMATIIDEAWQVANGTGSWNAVDRQCFQDANCGTVADDQIDAVRARLVAATTANGGNKLTAAQVQAAVKGS